MKNKEDFILELLNKACSYEVKWTYLTVAVVRDELLRYSAPLFNYPFSITLVQCVKEIFLHCEDKMGG